MEQETTKNPTRKSYSSDCVNDEDSDHVKDEYRNGVKRQRCFLDLFI